MDTRDMILICKALSDTNRLEIVRMLSDGEKCGCKILDKFDITQPTLSHHMKILVDCGLVNIATVECISYGHFRSGSMVLFPAMHRKSADLPGKWY